VKGDGPRKYLYEYESYWDPERKTSRQRLVHYHGPCDKKGKVLKHPSVRVDNVHSAFSVGPLAVFYTIAQELQIVERIKETLVVDPPKASLILLLALNQTVHRLPLSRLPDWALASPFPRWQNLDPNNINRPALDDALSAISHLSPERDWDQRGYLLQESLTRAWRGSSREPAAYYYDITKQPYYGTSCPWAAVGHDANGGLSPVVGFGLVVSRDHHHPVLCRPLPGSVNDTVTVADTLEMLQAFGLKGVTLVMDRGMISKANIDRVKGAEYQQVGLVRDWNDQTREYASRWPGEALEKPAFAVARSNGTVAYARAFTAPLFGRDMRVGLIEDFQRKAEERQIRDLMLSELSGHPSPQRLREIRQQFHDAVRPSVGRRGFQIDQKAMEREKALDGRFLLFSTDMSMDARKMYEIYFGKDAIEKVFRTGKGELSLGPIRYRRKDRVDAYATILYMSFLLWSWAECKLHKKYPAMSLDEAIRSLENISWVRFGAGKCIRDWVTRMTDQQEDLMKALGAERYLHSAQNA
jgi:hypothetical protein